MTPFFARVKGSTSITVYVVAFVPGGMGPVAIYLNDRGDFKSTPVELLIFDIAENEEEAGIIPGFPSAWWFHKLAATHRKTA